MTAPPTTAYGSRGQLRRATGGRYAQAAGRSGIWTCDGVLVAQAGPETGATTHATLS